MFLQHIHITFIYLVLGISQCIGWTTIASYNYVSTRHIKDDGSRKILFVLAESSTDESLGRSQAEMDLLQLAQGHFVSQALVTVLKCGVFDVLLTSSLTVDEIISKIAHVQGNRASSINRDALFRCMRLLCTTGVINETINKDNDSAFSLTDMGRLLQCPSSDDESSMAPFILHWSSHEIWDSWLQLPGYVVGDDSNLPPFDRSHNMSCSEYYKNNAEECSHRNAVARQTSQKEISSILDALKVHESNLIGKTLVDIGGGYGDMMYSIKKAIKVGDCYCLDLPDVIEDAISTTTESNDNDDTYVSLIPGDMFDTSTIPQCDYIFTKHVLCDFSDEDVVRALQSFHKALSKGGKCIIMDAVLPNCDDLNGKWNAAVSFDVLLMLSGRRGERSQLEWSNLAKKAGFVLNDVLSTSTVTVDLAILSKV